MPRFFVPQEQLPIISGQDAHQIKDVLRMKVGDELELLNGMGQSYQAKIAEIKKDKIIYTIIGHQTLDIGSRTDITLAQCLPKHKKMDLIIQKCTELGVAKIIPTLSERSVAKAEKLERWQKIAKESSEQSGRAIIPEISQLTKFTEVLNYKGQYNLALIPWELEKTKTLKQALSIVHSPLSIVILIGPEGGFSHNEVVQAKAAGFIPITLGKRILRTETAGLSILSMLNYHFDQ